jgi:hypothetical protein
MTKKEELRIYSQLVAFSSSETSDTKKMSFLDERGRKK